MDITDSRFDPLPAAGKLRFVNDGGVARLLDSNGKRRRVTVEDGAPVNGYPAAIDFTLSGRAIANEAIVVGGVTYTWKASVTLPNEIKIGAATASDDLDSLVAAINASASTTLYGAGTVANPGYSAAKAGADAVYFTARSFGPTNYAEPTGAMSNGTFDNFIDGAFSTEGSMGDMMVTTTHLYVAVADISKTTANSWLRTAIS